MSMKICSPTFKDLKEFFLFSMTFTDCSEKDTFFTDFQDSMNPVC